MVQDKNGIVQIKGVEKKIVQLYHEQFVSISKRLKSGSNQERLPLNLHTLLLD